MGRFHAIVKTACKGSGLRAKEERGRDVVCSVCGGLVGREDLTILVVGRHAPKPEAPPPGTLRLKPPRWSAERRAAARLALRDDKEDG